jgi:non-heme chloroperoxidase
MRVTLRENHHLHLRAKGSGPDILLLHGWVVSGEVWQPVLDRWPTQGAGRLLAVDLRGAGWSSKPQAGYTPEDHAADISALIDALKLKNIVLVGHSMGGLIAQRVALDRPDIIGRLVLVCPVPASGAPMPEDQIKYLHSLGGHPEGVQQVITMLITAPTEPRAIERLVLAASATSDGAFHEALDAWRQASFAEQLAQIKAPTTIIATESDHTVPPAMLREVLLSRISGASFIELPGCGHYPQLEATEPLTKLLLEASNKGA